MAGRKGNSTGRMTGHVAGMIFKYQPLYLVLLILATIHASGQQVIPLINAHAHNDYEHLMPLREALDHGFVSVEVDVHLINNRLYVAHDTPSDLSNVLTLEELYLDPLYRLVKAQGYIYEGYRGFFYLMIDIKTEAETSYVVLKRVLSQYETMLSMVTDSTDQQQKPVKVFISGNRPLKQFFADPVKYAGLDGRPPDLKKKYPSAWMPVISQQYHHYISWDGTGEPNSKETLKLTALIEEAHQQGKKVRLWGTPDTQVVWKFLLDHGIDLINTDKIQELGTFLTDYTEK